MSVTNSSLCVTKNTGYYNEDTKVCICRVGYYGSYCEEAFEWFGPVLLVLTIVETIALAICLFWITLRLLLLCSCCRRLVERSYGQDNGSSSSTTAAANSITIPPPSAAGASATVNSTTVNGTSRRPPQPRRQRHRHPRSQQGRVTIAVIILIILVCAHMIRIVYNWMPSEQLGIAREAVTPAMVGIKGVMIYVNVLGLLIAMSIAAVFWHDLLADPMHAHQVTHICRKSPLHIASLCLVGMEGFALLMGFILLAVDAIAVAGVFLDICILANVIFIIVIVMRIRKLDISFPSSSKSRSQPLPGKGRTRHHATPEERRRWAVRWLLSLAITLLVYLVSHGLIFLIPLFVHGEIVLEALKIIPTALERICNIVLALGTTALMDYRAERLQHAWFASLHVLFCCCSTDWISNLSNDDNGGDEEEGGVTSSLSSANPAKHATGAPSSLPLSSNDHDNDASLSSSESGSDSDDDE